MAKATPEIAVKQQWVQLAKKATMHVQHIFLYIQFAVDLHDYNVKPPETF